MTAIERAQPQEQITLLDVYAESGVAEYAPRLDALGTISAGSKAPNAKAPTINRDGSISLHDPEGRAAGLAATLSAADGKRLTIAFPFDEWSACVQMRFAEYSASRLLAYGDEKGITQIKEGGQRVFLEAGTPEFVAQKARCKVTTNVYFVLAAWNLKDADGGNLGPGVTFPDGLGFYRLRFTSGNSLKNLLSAWNLIKKLSGGRIAGVPLDLQLVNREVSGPDGSRRNVPVWTFTMRPPTGIQLTSRNFQATLSQALKSGQDLVLPAPDSEAIDAAFVEVLAPDQDELPALTDREVRQLENGFNADAVRRQYFALTEETPFRHRPGRAELIEAATGRVSNGLAERVTDSLSKALDWADQDVADCILKTAQVWAESWKKQAGEIRTLYALAGKHNLDTSKLQTEFAGWREDAAKTDALLARLNELTKDLK